MPTTPNTQPQIDNLERQNQSTLKSLQSSQTAKFGEQDPSFSDVTKQQQLIKTQDQIKKLKDDKLRLAWYGPTKPEEAIGETEGAPAGVLERGIDALSRPLYSVAGAFEHMLGNSGEVSLADAMNKNASTKKRTFGTFVKESGLPTPVAMPLGFIMDVGLDPLNWMTAGTTALVPRIFKGGVQAAIKEGTIKAGLKAAARGAESRVLEGALTAGKLSSLWKLGAKKATEEVVTEPGIVKKSLTSAGDWLKKEAVTSTNQYNELTGRDFLKTIGEKGKLAGVNADSPYRLQLGDLIREVAASPSLNKGGLAVNKYFKYFDINNKAWTDLATLKDTLLKTTGSEEKMKIAIKSASLMEKTGMPREQAVEEVVKQMGLEEKFLNMPAVPAEVLDADIAFYEKIAKENGEVGTLSDQIKTAKDIVENPQIYTVLDDLENGKRLAEETLGKKVSLDDLRDVIGRANLDETGWKWFDDKKQELISIQKEIRFGKHATTVGEVMEKTINKIEELTTYFKLGKVAAAPTAWVNAIVGNPSMAWMAGVNILDPLYMAHIKKGAGLVRNSDAGIRWMKELLETTDILDTLKENPTLFQKTTGLSQRELTAQYALKQALETAKENGINFEGMDISDLAAGIGKEVKGLTDAIEVLSGNKNAEKLLVGKAGEVIDRMAPKNRTWELSKKIGEGIEISKSDLPSSYVAQELLESKAVSRKLAEWKTRAEQGDTFAKIMDLTYNKMASGYEKIDQSYKMGTFSYLNQAGVTEKELNIIARTMKLSPEDMTPYVLDGVTRYKMNGTRALELVNEIYLNYAAMPAAVNVLKNLPLVGHPFAAFGWGMLNKTAKTAVYNPAFFSKATSALQDFSAEKSPLEKAAMKNPQYSYMNSPTMFKLGLDKTPFFDKYSTYLNLNGVLPYYSLNMFAPPNRKYNDLYSDAVVGTIDKLPILKHPVATTIFDYFIQPMVLKEGMTPLGSFGQPLYPSDATALGKTGYFARTLAESMVPSIWSVPGARVVSPIAEQFIPGITNVVPSDRWRQLYNATKGENRQGITGKEDINARVGRTTLNALGIPLQTPINLTNLPKNLQAQLNKK